MLSVEEARDAIVAHVVETGVERVDLGRCPGRVLAEHIVAPTDNPPFDNSAMDGYAVRWQDVAEVSEERSVTLPVAVEVPAGRGATVLEPGTAARIMTGARMPEGADTVIMREDTIEHSHQVEVRALPRAGRGAHIRLRGENVMAGTEVLCPGALIDSGTVGLLASFGKLVVLVRRRPVVAVVATGNELVEIDREPGEGQIRNSSSAMLAAMIQACGAVPAVLPIARDSVEDTTRVLAMAARHADIVVSTGGVSVGDYDVVRAVLTDLCGELSFWKVRMKPGKPLAFGTTRDGNVPLIGLPGNPVSTWVSFWQFVRPAIQRAQGLPAEPLDVVVAVLGSALRSTRNRLELVRGRLTTSADHPGRHVFDPYPWQGSGNLMSVVGTGGLARIPVGVEQLQAGAEVEVEVLPRHG